jgi:cytochrome c2
MHVIGHHWLVGCAIAAVGLAISGCDGWTHPPRSNFGNTEEGSKLIREFGCGTCHSIPRVEGADGTVGPPLDAVGRRTYLAGTLLNTPDNMMKWIRDPQRFAPGTVMPKMGLSSAQARDVTAYLQTLQ